MSALSVALAHYRRRAQRARALERQAADLWRQVNRSDIAGSWSSLMPQLFVTLSAMQQAEAAEADAYVALAMAEQGEAAEAAQRIVPETWSGWASDGRALDSLLMQPVVTAKVAIRSGETVARSMAYGQAALQMIVGTQVADAGRVADQAAMVTHGSQGYIRMVVGDTCSRCVVLAGKWYRWNAGFDRHPRCDCVGIPAAEDRADDLRTDPGRYFRSLSHDKQAEIFGKAGSQAIRDGADIAQVVNAKRKSAGLYSAGGKRYTRESTHAKRGITRGRPRLTVEQIYKDAHGSRERAIELLRRHRYIVDLPQVRAADFPAATSAGLIQVAGRDARRLPGRSR